MATACTEVERVAINTEGVTVTHIREIKLFRAFYRLTDGRMAGWLDREWQMTISWRIIYANEKETVFH